jgi:DNA-directed RNA polymerase specialized sigma24 family protein
MGPELTIDRPIEQQSVMADKLKSGDDSVIEMILRAYGPMVERELSQFPVLRPYIDDILAQALYHLWVHRGQYDPRWSISTWLLGIARNIARDMHRHEQRAPQPVGLDPSVIDTFFCTRGGGVEPPHGPRAELQAITEILAGLAETDRAIVLAYVQSGGKGCWTKDLVDQLHLNAGHLRVKRKRIFNVIECKMRQRGFFVSDQNGEKQE